MKNFKILKTVLLLVAVMAFSNCDENGPLEQAIRTNEEISIQVEGLKDKSSHTVNDQADIQDLLDNASDLITAEIDQVKFRIENYIGTSAVGNKIEGSITVNIGSIELFESQIVSLSSTDSTISVPAEARDILDLVNTANNLPLDLSITIKTKEGTVIEDNDFQLIVTPRITGVITL